MQIRQLFIFLVALASSNLAWSQASQHSGHGSGSSDMNCIKAKVSNFNPAHLANIAPGGEFSFMVSGSNGPGHIHVTIREQAIPLKVESKDTFYLAKGNLPAEIKNQTVRISYSAKAKNGKCDADGGWLVKVSE